MAKDTTVVMNKKQLIAVKRQLREKLKADLADWKKKFRSGIAEYITLNKGKTYDEVAEQWGSSNTVVCEIAVEYGVQRARGTGSPASKVNKNV